MTREALATVGLATLAIPAVNCNTANPPAKPENGRRGQPPERAKDLAASTKAQPKAPRCPLRLANCERARGRVVYVERVDPDGGGDAHLVLASREGLTAPGITLVDLERAVRPKRLPRPGDWVGAAGPVYRGSHGQRQIEATRLRLMRARYPRQGGS